MKTSVPLQKMINYLFLVIISLSLSFSGVAQTYTTIANGAWSSASTWQGGVIPNATAIPAAAVINIRHIVTYTGGNINNSGTINISNATGLAPRLMVSGGINFTNNTGGKFYIKDGEYRQYRFVGGGETGTAQSGTFKNNGGYVNSINSFVEVAQDWSNESTGVVYFKNSSLIVGRNYDLKNSAIDTLIYTSVSLGMQGSGDYTADGQSSYFQSLRVEVASTSGKFLLKSGIANGYIDYIALKNHVTGVYSTEKITTGNGLLTAGLSLNAYCTASPANYVPNGMFSGAQAPDCSLNYFPAKLFASNTPGSLNFSSSPVLVSGTNLKAGAVYKFEGIAPGIDAIVTIDSLIGGASINKIDDNSGGLGYIEGFQPEVQSGPLVGESYAVFTMEYKITGTNVPYPLATFNITALDIDGDNTMKEFDQIIVTPGAVATYMTSTTDIKLTEVVPGSFRGINIAGIERAGIDTSSKANMFTVSANDLSAVTLKLGTVKTNTQQVGRQYGIYFKGFVYPNLTTLPVKMESFTATMDKNGNQVDLNWVTASELNLSHFVVERSTDGINFSDAGVVFANGNSSNRLTYSLADNISMIKTTLVYYRLRSVDVDGNDKYSETRIIRLSKQTDQLISILTYPNPVTNELRITVPASWQNKKAVFEIYSANGQVVKRMEKSSSSQTETLNVSNLLPAFYIVIVKCNGETAQQRIIKQ